MPLAVQDVAVRTRILLVDDHTTFTELLAGSLNRESDLRCVGQATSVRDGIEQCRRLLPDVVVMDYHLSDGSGLTAAATILAEVPDTRVIVLTGDPSATALEQAARIGVCAFLPKDGSLALLLETVRHARAGGIVVHPSLVAQLNRLHRPGRDATPLSDLTRREHQVLCLMARGHDVRANAIALGISENTCRGYVKAIHAKLGAHSQLEAVVIATRLGLLSARYGE